MVGAWGAAPDTFKGGWAGHQGDLSRVSGMSKTLRVSVNSRWYTVEVEDPGASPVRALVDGEPVEVHIDQVLRDDSPVRVEEPGPGGGPAPAALPSSRATAVPSPMPGLIVSVAVQVGDRLAAGDEICVLEAMKMQQALRAESPGVVSAVHVQPGQQVFDGDPIVDLG